MAKTEIIQVPDIGDFKNVAVIEVLISPGDRIETGAGLITIESDKATMEIPSPRAGLIEEIELAVGDKVSMGSPIAKIGFEASGETPAETSAKDRGEGPPTTPEAPGATSSGVTSSGITSGEAEDSTPADIQTQVLVLGAGPGGYTAAFRAADLGKKTVLVERYPALGGVCLNVGCIPSKAYLHTAGILHETRQMAARGVTFGKAEIDLAKLVAWKTRLVDRLAKGIAALAKQRKIQVVRGTGAFLSPNRLRVQSEGKTVTIAFEHAIIATGSGTVALPGLPQDDPRLWNSTDALNPTAIPQRLLVIGGGIIGLEMATLYNALGSRVSVVELQDGLIPGCDRDLVRPLQKHIARQYENIFLSTRVTGIEPRQDGLQVSFDGQGSGQSGGKGAPESDRFDAVLVAVGRAPNGRESAPDRAGVYVDERGFIPVDKEQRTNCPHILAIGDVVGEPMLAHKATHQGKVAAEVIAGLAARFDARAIPSVAYTDPEVAWMGMTEEQLEARGIAYEKGTFPWAASGRALGIGRGEGITKLLFDKHTRRVIGAGIVGPHAGDLIAEAVLALEMGADAEDLALTIHPHPTLSETLGLAGEAAAGTITDLMPRKAPHKK
uniref:Dihydrolipoyl dehydrogenase n=1 Tax=Candidatus Kentrum sp. FM TaxID=2126340 RepID=A0A450WSF9_9GAMM|nr:MAG: dihydrolipoamide dehydrogenase [Candidatus Kentron sp. FM]VFJ71568.1 MAG: dihydrolipoamide dehydrogenase [Candidatus Kentron sp. FM]VFK19950.1 MAG: dihydrolipoamide dehydrogenase [Candidatus Kentron sp. FM]